MIHPDIIFSLAIFIEKIFIALITLFFVITLNILKTLITLISVIIVITIKNQECKNYQRNQSHKRYFWNIILQMQFANMKFKIEMGSWVIATIYQ